LELFEGAVQIINKMSLKTTGNIPIHGSDAIHFGLKDDLKILYLGESKTGEKFSTILEYAFESTETYNKEEKEKFDLVLASGYISEDIPEEFKNVVKDYLNPNKNDLSNFCKTHAIFLGYQYDEISACENDYDIDVLYDNIIKRYKQDIEKYIEKIENGFEKHSTLKNCSFLFFIIPFRDLKKFREKFLKEIR